MQWGLLMAAPLWSMEATAKSAGSLCLERARAAGHACIQTAQGASEAWLTTLPASCGGRAATQQREEGKAASHSLAGEGQLAHLFAFLDLNRDGVVSFEEFRQAVGRHDDNAFSFSEAELRYAFDEADVDGQEGLTAEALASLLSRLALLPPAARGEEVSSLEQPGLSLATSSGSSSRGRLARWLDGLAMLRRQQRLATALLRASLRDRLPEDRRPLAKQCLREALKTVPFVLATFVLPGGFTVFPAVVMAFPAIAPVAFRDAIGLKPGASSGGPDEFEKLTTRVFRAVVDGFPDAPEARSDRHLATPC